MTKAGVSHSRHPTPLEAIAEAEAARERYNSERSTG